MVEHFSKDQMSEFKDAFHLYARNSDGTISTSDLGIVLRCIGQNPSECDLQSMIKEIDVNKTGKIEFNNFLTMIAKRGIGGNAIQEIIDSFEIFDKEKTGFMNITDFKDLMDIHGDDKEIAKLIKEAHVNSEGKVNYKDFIQKMFAH